jgi:hypothetical protein
VPDCKARIIVGRTARQPVPAARHRTAGFEVEADPAELRGTGGVLRDLAERHDDNDLLLVANAAQVLVEPLTAIAEMIGECGGDVTVLANADGTPTSILLLSCRALRDLPRVGFVDLKEQGLACMAARHDVRVCRRPSAAGMPSAPAADYLRAVDRFHTGRSNGDTPSDRPFSERWRRRFSIVETGAVVADGAELHNAVVLRGARVGAGALVSDSVLCDGAAIGRREHIAAQLISRHGRTVIDGYGS